MGERRDPKAPAVQVWATNLRQLPSRRVTIFHESVDGNEFSTNTAYRCFLAKAGKPGSRYHRGNTARDSGGDTATTAASAWLSGSPLAAPLAKLPTDRPAVPRRPLWRMFHDSRPERADDTTHDCTSDNGEHNGLNVVSQGDVAGQQSLASIFPGAVGIHLSSFRGSRRRCGAHE